MEGLGFGFGFGEGSVSTPAALALDFVTQGYATNGTYYPLTSLPGWSFTRASTATATDSKGNVLSFASGVPAITDLGLGVWESRTNLLLWSQDTTNSAWNLSANAPVKTGAVGIAPDGTLTANRIARTSTASSYVTQALSKSASAIGYSNSFYFKQGSARYVSLRVQGTYPARVDLQVDLQTGTFSAAPVGVTFTGVSGTITPAAFGYYRVAVTATSDAAAVLGVYVSPSNVPGNAVDSVDSLASGYIDWWGAQLEQGAFPTPYIPTTSAAATRAGDIPIITGLSAATVAKFPGQLMTQVMITHPTSGPTSVEWAAQLNDTSLNNRLGMFRPQSSSDVGFRYITGGVATNPGNATVAWAANGVHTSSIIWNSVKTSGIADAIAGTDAAAASGLPTITQLSIGCDNGGGNQFNGYIQRIVSSQ